MSSTGGACTADALPIVERSARRWGFRRPIRATCTISRLKRADPLDLVAVALRHSKSDAVLLLADHDALWHGANGAVRPSPDRATWTAVVCMPAAAVQRG